MSGRAAGAMHPVARLATAALLGAASVYGYAPFRFAFLPILALALLFVLWERGGTARTAAATGFAFGLGFFLAGTSWVYISLHTFGEMPAPVAAVATLGFCMVVALYPALAGWLAMRVVHGGGRASAPTSGDGAGADELAGAADRARTLRLLAGMPAAWTVGEVLRATLLTGFPWLGLGYSQVPDSPLAGYAAVLGSHGVTLSAALVAGTLALLALRLPLHSARLAVLPATAAIVVTAAGAALQRVEWTEPVGAPVRVALAQGNVPQERKFDLDLLPRIFALYRDLVERTDARIVILPETALPTFLHRVDDAYLDALRAHATARNGDVLFGVAVADPQARAYYNSVVTIGASPPQIYRKYHLVPFGEYLPLRPLFGWVLDVLRIPMADFSPGPGDPKTLEVAGQKLAVGICYEDAFGALALRQLPEATMLVNVSNDAWFGHSAAAEQHWQIAQMRALEAGRPMLRANNTGITGIIGADGRGVARLEPFTTGTLAGAVAGRTGATPYVRWGDGLILGLVVAALAGAAVAARRPAARRLSDRSAATAPGRGP